MSEFDYSPPGESQAARAARIRSREAIGAAVRRALREERAFAASDALRRYVERLGASAAERRRLACDRDAEARARRRIEAARAAMSRELHKGRRSALEILRRYASEERRAALAREAVAILTEGRRW